MGKPLSSALSGNERTPKYKRHSWRNVMLSELKTRLRALLRRSQVEHELDEELRFHIKQQTEQNIRLGMAPEEARVAALRSFGGVEQAKELSRDARGGRPIEDLWQALRFGARLLRRSPGFSFLAILCLTIGIGATTAVFSWIEGLLLRPFPAVAHQERMMAIAG